MPHTITAVLTKLCHELEKSPSSPLKKSSPPKIVPVRRETKQSKTKTLQEDVEFMKLLSFPIMLPEAAAAGHSGESATLTVYLRSALACAPDRVRPAILICPGGSYLRVSDREGEPVAMQYLAMGYHVMVLDYSVAPDTFPTALLELAASVALIREHAGKWLVDPNRIIVSGFSAGGHLACSLGVFWNRDFVSGALNLTPAQVRPNGLILCYPVISSGLHCHRNSFECLLGPEAGDKKAREAVSLELQVSSDMPKTFLWHTWTDQSVPVENSLLLAGACAKADVNLEMHLYPVGAHGVSLATEDVSEPDGTYVVEQCQSWMPLVKKWLECF